MRNKPALIPVLASAMLATRPAFSQGNTAPVITGVVNAASYTQPVAPGSLVSIFGSSLASATQSAGAPTAALPTSLAGTSVSFNGVAAGLVFVSPSQINAQLPSAAVSNATSPSTVSVVVSNSLGSSASASVSAYGVGPGIFTDDASGCGPAAALSTTPDGLVSVNSTSNSAAPGDYISIFGTGLGVPKVAPPDGTAAARPEPFTASGSIYVDRAESGVAPSYSGLAPDLVGVDQINFQIPYGTRDGCAVPISMEGDPGLPSPLEAFLIGPLVTLSVGKTRGQCADPPTQSYGEVWLERTIASGTSNDGETDEFYAVFPAGPGLQIPPLPDVTPSTIRELFPSIPAARVCPVQGYSGLSAGTISIQGPGQTAAVSAAPAAWAAGGVYYHQTLPAGFVQRGQYTVSSQSGVGAPVNFSQGISVDAGLTSVGYGLTDQPLTAGTTLTPSTDHTINWVWGGGDPSTIVRVTLTSTWNQIASYEAIFYAYAGAGQVTISYCASMSPSSGCLYAYPLPGSPRGQGTVIVDVLPGGGVADTVNNVRGISQQVRFSWAYHYVFGGLSIED